MYVSLGLSVASILLVTTQNDSSKAGFIGIAGGTIGFIGTVIYLDSYKFLNFKSKLKKKNSQRAINY